jgi:predicted transposase YbfD/YdcC
VTEKGHGRTETRRTSVYALSEPGEVGLFGTQTLIKTERSRTVHKTGATSQETVWHLCTQESSVRKGPQWAATVRDHWGIESRNHNRRDAQLLEDKTRSRNPKIVGNLAVARAALLFFNAHTSDANVNVFVENCRDDRQMALRLLTAQKPFK